MTAPRIGSSNTPTLSFEFFPPKTPKGEENFWIALGSLARHNPDFVSVTYGAAGGVTSATERLVNRAHEKLKLVAMPHITCLGHTEEELRTILASYKARGATHVLALRGDRPKEIPDDWQSGPFGYANEFVEMITREFPEFSIGVAAYPEKHPEAPDAESDLANFEKKVQAGADFAITQFFYDNDAYFEFVKRCVDKGMDLPIIPGILPFTDYNQIQRFAALCGSVLPVWLTERMEKVKDDPDAMVEVGVATAIELCQDLLDRGVPGLHFFTLNKSEVVNRILAGLKGIG
ncbi:MAG: methylenetetrahydrofolate reductase [NAD(P)H] [Magnetococcales bacterium]|nr:methylenetetrahydrofolate reductase [NAD(P)H] [Magnetococcales bacterium]